MDQDASAVSITTENNTKWEYVWVVQHYSIQECPDCWQHPLKILVDFVSPLDGTVSSLEQSILELQRQRNTTDSTQEITHNSDTDIKESQTTAPQSLEGSYQETQDSKQSIGKGNLGNIMSSLDCQSLYQSPKSIKESFSEIDVTVLESSRNGSLRRLLKRDFSGCVFSTVPRSLALNCTLQHLHKWQSHLVEDDELMLDAAAYLHGRVKVICSSGIIYRFVYKI